MKIKRIVLTIVVLALVLAPYTGFNIGNYDKVSVQAKENADKFQEGMKAKSKTELAKRNNRLSGKNTKYNKYKKISEAALSMRKSMVNHESQIIAYVKTTNSSPVQVFEALENEVLKETKNGDEGDYLRWDIDREYPSYSYFSAKIKGKKYYFYEFRMEIWYFTTLEQKKQVDERVKEIVSDFEFGEQTSDYEKVKTIYDYVCENVTYAKDIAKDIVYTSWSALFRGEAVCQGYAQLMYRFLKEVGISARVIPGYGSGDVLHGWNIVKLGNYYYNLDSTWDSEIFHSGRTYKYFLKGDKFPKHTRLSDYYKVEFYNKYPMAEKEYGSKEQEASLRSRQAKFCSIKPKFNSVSRKKMSWKKVAGAYGYKIQYSTNKKFHKNNKIVSTKKRSYRLKKIKKSENYYVRFRAYKFIDGKKVYTKWSNQKKIKKRK